jgi:hypothetical protein
MYCQAVFKKMELSIPFQTLNSLHLKNSNSSLVSGNKQNSLQSDGNPDTHETHVPTCTLIHTYTH